MVSLNRHRDFRGALAGELLAAAAQPPLPDAIRVVMLMGSPAGACTPIDTFPPGFACPPMMYGAPVPLRSRPFRRDDIMEGELDDVIAALVSAQAADQLAELEAATGV